MPKMLVPAAAFVAVLCLAPRPKLETQDTAAETVLVNGKIVTVDRAFSTAEAAAISAGKFTAVGSNAEIRALAGPNTRTIDLHGRTVVPGLADGHLHGAGGGPGVDLSRTRSLDEVLSAIGQRVAQSNPGDIIVTNSDWHEAQLKEQRLPLRRDLDKVSANNPVVVVRGGHEYILNSRALNKWNITTATSQPRGGKISTYPDGELNGELLDAAKPLVKLPPPPERTLDERIQEQVAELKTLNASGLTSIRLPGTGIEQYRLLEEIKKRGLLTMRVNVLLRPNPVDAATVRATLQGWGVDPNQGAHDEWLQIGGIKIGVDGGFEGGYMREPYAEPYGQNGAFRGLQTIPDDRYTEIVKELNRLGWRVATHAVGDAAIDQVLNAYEAANAERTIVGRRWVLEHGFIPRDDHYARIRKLDLVVSAQNHLYLAGPSLVKYWGPRRAAWTTPVRAYLDQGFVVAGGTDSPVVPYPPLWVIYHFVSRDTIAGGVLGADQKITREEALRIETINNAYLIFQEKMKGSIEPGKLADLVVLSDDILTCPEKQIEKTTVLLTMVAGNVVYENAGFRSQ